eukprot:TRINITY_DN2264_c0_g2_i1.p1 TRINITY_DN2264_c0_g2~~TRINITY_DN2264_c0_g2_i1.p1  ORF type:complete len:195 (+),score=34.25 TRINITY_DN2264_c0_g2_i1:199-783(+)
MDMDMDLERADTITIKDTFRQLGKVVLCSGMCSSMMYFLLCSCFIWYSRTINTLCDADYKDVFFWLGVCNGLLGVAGAIVTVAGREMIDAMAHAKLSEKWRQEGRIEEAEEAESEVEEEVQKATRMVAFPTCLYVFAQAGLLTCWIWGWVTTMGANIYCSNAATTFYWLLFLNALSSCMSMFSGTNTARGYRSY